MEEQIEEQKQSVETTPAPAAESNIQSAPAATIAEAQLGQRIGAAIIDVIVAIAVGWVASMISGRLYFPAFAAYMLTRDSLPFLNGQSIGKKVLNLQAVSESGKSLSGDWKTGLLRNVSMVIPFGGLVELIVMLVGKDKPGGIRRLGDQWAVTKVVSVSSGS